MAKTDPLMGRADSPVNSQMGVVANTGQEGHKLVEPDSRVELAVVVEAHLHVFDLLRGQHD